MIKFCVQLRFSRCECGEIKILLAASKHRCEMDWPNIRISIKPRNEFSDRSPCTVRHASELASRDCWDIKENGQSKVQNLGSHSLQLPFLAFAISGMGFLCKIHVSAKNETQKYVIKTCDCAYAHIPPQNPTLLCEGLGSVDFFGIPTPLTRWKPEGSQ